MATFQITVPPRQGAYRIDGKRYPRVSTILGVISKPGLWEWKLRVGLEEADRIRRASADFGTALHAACEAIDRDWLGYDRRLVATELRPLVAAYCAWAIDAVAEVPAIEQVVYHERFVYAGTLDRVFRLRDGRLVVADFKTGATVDGTTRLQLSAYALAWEAMGYEPVQGRLVIHLPRDRPGHLAARELDDDERDARAWKRCLGLWRWWQRHQHEYREWRA